MKHHHPVLKHPGRWIWLPLLVPIVIGLARLRFDAEVFDLLPANLPVVQGLKLYQDNFANARELIITLQGKEAEQVSDAARRIAGQLRLHTNLVESVTWEPPWTEHPDQMAEFLAYLWFNQPPKIFEQLSRRLSPVRLGGAFAAARQQLATAFSPQEVARRLARRHRSARDKDCSVHPMAHSGSFMCRRILNCAITASATAGCVQSNP
jgi:uncharacterized protein